MSAQIIYTDAFVRSATDTILRIMEKALDEKGVFRLSLCGGSTPFPVYSQLALEGTRFRWDRVIITFGDERCVPPDHEQSNFRAAKLNFFDRVPIPADNILRVKGELDPEAAAADYESQLDAVAARFEMASFNHDLLLLGIGEDGHTASLFPDTAALNVTDRRVAANYVPKLNAHRVTFTFPFINRAETVMYLVNDAKKKKVVADILAKNGNYPAARVEPESKNLIWMLGGMS